MSIVTLPCSIKSHRAVSFDVIGVYRDRIFVVDRHTEWNGYASVIDAAEHVWRYCESCYGPKRVICGDDRWCWREIVRDEGAFAIVPYRENFPLGVISDMFLNGGG